MDEPAGSLKRAVVILKTLASAGENGLALTQLSQRCGLPHSSAHRVLRQLCDARLVYQTVPDGSYALGPLAFEVGVAAAQQFDIRGRSRQAVAALAKEVGDTAYLFLRSGNEAVCLDRVFGPSPVRVVTLRIGSRRPLGLGGGGLAILAALSEAEREAVIEDVVTPLGSEWAIEESTLRKLVSVASKQGYSFIEGQITPGVSSVGKAILDSFGSPIGAVSIAAAVTRLPRSRLDDVAGAVDRAVGRIQVALFASAARKVDG